MSGIYYTDLVDVLRGAGCQVQENGTTNGWQNRARSSGGFPSAPLGVQWHHTASSTSPANDLSWMINGSDDAPIGNVLLDRNGVYWPIAAGAANTAGKGGPLNLSRGQVPLDQANTRTFAIEAANNGVGEVWPQAQIDAYFRGSNALNARFGNQPTDVFNHQSWAPTRKIDPSTANVAGPWVPRTSTSSGTWNQDDVRNECAARSGGGTGDDFLMGLSQEDQQAMRDTILGALPGQYSNSVRGPGMGGQPRVFALDDQDGNYIATMLQNICNHLGIPLPS